ncbi:MAG: helicase-related protein, partial [Thermomicrobiales bacterium]
MSVAGGAKFQVGSLVTSRGREWVVLPSDDPDVLRLRPLGGTESDATGVYLPLERDDVRAATFALPDPARPGDSVEASLLRDAVRLNFRAGAGPFRSLGRIAVEPRAYQLVPLLMALRLEPVRLLIADDVGIGKTVEALLIARELLDRGEIKHITVICPPHLCDQWQAEMAEKFGIEAEVVRSGSVARLERNLTADQSVFEAYPFLVVSIDYIKSDRRRDDFVRACAEFVIVDEAHTAAAASGKGAQQQRHSLLQALAKDPARHMVLTTATPHSGVAEAFRSLLSLLSPDFAALPLEDGLQASSPERERLAKHLIQRRRQHIRTYLDDTTRFPNRVTSEVTYGLSSDARRLTDKVLDYARELVRDAEGGPARRQRIRWWAALAMLRCVSSSPAAAADTLRKRANGLEAGEELGVGDIDAFGERAVLDLDSSDATENDDVVPGSDTSSDDPLAEPERRRLLGLAREADKLRGANDRKLLIAVEIISQLLKDGFSPIIYCRYIATAEYVADELRKRLKGAHVIAVTGMLPPEERERRVQALEAQSPRVLVATDCLSEGINLQAGFDAVLHYDLSWNPTRHEQREGRVDRFGQQNPEVRTVLLYGGDNPVDGAVLRVLLRKAEDIRKTLGVLVPVPVDTTKVMEAVFESLFLGNRDPRQMALQFDTTDQRLQEVEVLWNESAEREKRSRSIFSQLAIKPELVRAELEEARRALGNYQDVERFVRNALARLGAPVGADAQGRAVVPVGELPVAVRE